MSTFRHDLPFEPKEVAHITRRLKALRIPLDRDWLSAEPLRFSNLIYDSHGVMLAEARQNIPQSNAQWELSDFFRYAVPGAAYDCQWLTSYAAFEFLYVRILGEAAKPWLPSLYLAAATLPSLVEEARVNAVVKFDTGVFFDNDS